MVEFNGIKAIASADSAAEFGGIGTAGIDGKAPAGVNGIKNVAAAPAGFGGIGTAGTNGIKVIATASTAAWFGGIGTAGIDSKAAAPAWIGYQGCSC